MIIRHFLSNFPFNLCYVWQANGDQSTYFMHKQIHLQTWHSPNGHTFNQIDHCLIDGRHFSDVTDVMARKGCKHRFSPHASRDKIESKNMPRRRGVCKGERGKQHRQRASHPNQNQRSQECSQTSPDKREAFVQKNSKAAQQRGFNRD
jgi:hypothetical protein